MSLPVISVVIVAYKRRQYIETAILSAFNQTLDKRYYEIIVVKDFTDAKIDGLIEKIGCKSIIVDEKNYGIKLAIALDIAKGMIITPLDDDDLFTPEKLSKIMTQFNENKRLILIHNAHNVMYPNGRIGRGLHHVPTSSIYYDTEKQDRKSLTKLISYEPYFNFSSISFKKDIFEKSIFLSTDLSGGYDTAIFILALSSKGFIEVNPEVMTIYRLHNSTSSLVSDDETFSRFKLDWYKRYTSSISTIRKQSTKFNFITNKFIDCLLIESKLNILILSNEKIQLESIVHYIWNFVRCKFCISLTKFAFLIILLTIRMVSQKVSRNLYLLNFKRSKFKN